MDSGHAACPSPLHSLPFELFVQIGLSVNMVLVTALKGSRIFLIGTTPKRRCALKEEVLV